MAVIEYDSYKQKLLAMDETFENLFKALEIEQARQELNRLELEAHEDGFWNDLERSQKNQMRSKQLQNKIHRYEKLVSTRDDLLALIDMGTEMDDASLLPELEEGYKKLEADVEQARLTTLLSGEYDNCNAILTFHAGAGGTEAQDWAQMLYRSICSGRSSTGLNSRCSTISTATRPVSRARRSWSRVRTPTAI